MEKFATLRVKHPSAAAWYKMVYDRSLSTNPTYVSARINYRSFGDTGESVLIRFEICLQWGLNECELWSSEDFAECFKQMEEFLISNK